MNSLLEKLDEWREAREGIFAADFAKIPLPDHKPFWDRLAKAEHDLMDEARKLK